MKQFNLQEYLANPNRQVVTRKGQKVRIVCTNRKGLCTKPVVALITLPNGDEIVKSFWENGLEVRGDENRNDLFFAPEKHEGWVNIYCAHTLSCGLIYQSEEKAKQEIDPVRRYITTTKIEWEE